MASQMLWTLCAILMQTFTKQILNFACGAVLFSQSACQSKHFGHWSVSSASHEAHISWSAFEWTNDSLGGRYFERTAMHIPVQVEELPSRFLFQFDLGADTRLYGNPLQTVFLRHPEFNRVKKYKSSVQFWDSRVAFKDLTLLFGQTSAKAKNCYVMNGFGKKLKPHEWSDSSTIALGTIGADLFQNKVLIIDYPNQRFTVLDRVPEAFQTTLVDITLDRLGRVILPMQLNEKSFKVLFDNGSSMFPLLTMGDKVNSFSLSRDVDTIPIWSWGKLHEVVGRPLKEPFQLAGRTYSDIMLYADYRPEAKTIMYDAIAGNALFWDKMVIIDFKNKKIGVK